MKCLQDIEEFSPILFLKISTFVYFLSTRFEINHVVISCLCFIIFIWKVFILWENLPKLKKFCTLFDILFKSLSFGKFLQIFRRNLELFVENLNVNNHLISYLLWNFSRIYTIFQGKFLNFLRKRIFNKNL